MRARFQTRFAVAAVFLIANVGVVLGQPTQATADVEKTLRSYFAAMSERDVEGLRAVLDQRFMLIEAKGESARTHILNTDSLNQLLPPEGNKDWDKDRMKIASIHVVVPDPSPSAATASVVVSQPLDDKAVAGMEEAFRIKAAQLDETQRKTVTRWIAARAMDRTFLAMLTKQAGAWKIVCLSVPKK